MKRLNLLFLLLALSMLMACETEIPFNGAVTDPMLVVNSIACSDSVLNVQVSASRFFLSSETTFPAVSNATVALYVNGVFTENLALVGDGRYQSNYVGKEGDAVRLDVSAAGFKSVSAETAFPEAVSGFQIDSAIVRTDTVPFGGSGYLGGGITRPTVDSSILTYSYIHQYKIHFSNPASRPDYFRLVVKQANPKDGIFYGNSYVNDFNDIVFGNKDNNVGGMFRDNGRDHYNVFSDELIDGDTHTISFSYTQSYMIYSDSTVYKPDLPDADWTLTIDVQAISKSYYLYLNSLKTLQSSDGFMSEPVQIYTNVKDGLGIFGTRTIHPKTFVLPK